MTDSFIGLTTLLIYAIYALCVFIAGMAFRGIVQWAWFYGNLPTESSTRRNWKIVWKALWPLMRTQFPTNRAVGIGICAAVAIVVHLIHTSILTIQHSSARVWLGTAIIVILGFGLYTVKTYALKTYAAIEGVFALTYCVHTLSVMHDVVEPLDLLSLLTSAYLMIRALDNLDKGMERPKGNGRIESQAQNLS